ncbi:hypothetical protein [Crocosphaera sp. Alani8]|uniref:hypothetical protein n=1 Tax=Crocosphaera sp. Alani8 TaxID=3038952 RepID=UPI00313BB603
MKPSLFKFALIVGNVLAAAQPTIAATFDLNDLILDGPGATLTDDGITVTYEVFTAGTADYRDSILFQGGIPLALTSRPTNGGNAFDSQGNLIVNGALPSVVNIQNYTVLTFRWDTTVTFVEGFDINDFDFDHSPLPGSGFHDAAAVIGERSNRSFFNVKTSNFGSGLESYTANLTANPTNIVDSSADELPFFLNSVNSLEAYRNNDHKYLSKINCIV